jgi:hypothetical protein
VLPNNCVAAAAFHRRLSRAAAHCQPALSIPLAHVLFYLMTHDLARRSTPGLRPGQFAVRVPVPGIVCLPDLIIKRVAGRALSNMVHRFFFSQLPSCLSQLQGGCVLHARRAEASFVLKCGIPKVSLACLNVFSPSSPTRRFGLSLATERSSLTYRSPRRHV